MRIIATMHPTLTLQQQHNHSQGCRVAAAAGAAGVCCFQDWFASVLHAAELLVTNNGLTSLPDSICSLPLLRTLIVEGAEVRGPQMHNRSD
jgi:hypothetical protein